jgi:branched-chain amino acid transport system ATP-binding protein
MLTVKNLEVCYGAISALRDVTFHIEAGRIVTLIGGNGAGKTTTLRTISGLLRAKKGGITFKGEDISKLPPHQIVARGLCHVPEGRMVFSNSPSTRTSRWAPTSRPTRQRSRRTATTSSASSPA